MSESLVTIAHRILKERRNPMHSHDLTQEVLKFRQTSGKTPEATLVSAMIRDDRFVGIGRGTYGLKEWHPEGVVTEKAGPIRAVVKESDLYEPVLNALKVEYFPDSCHMEITANGKLSKILKKELDDAAFFFLESQGHYPDISGFMDTEESSIGLGILAKHVRNRITAEVKNEEIKVDHIYQTKRYAEIFDAKYAFLVSTDSIPEDIRRFVRQRPSVITYIKSGNETRRLIFLTFDEKTGKLELEEF